jgi:hypothetical protein
LWTTEEEEEEEEEEVQEVCVSKDINLESRSTSPAWKLRHICRFGLAFVWL